MREKILIITHENDHDLIDDIIFEARSLGAEVIRFDTNRYPLQIQLSTEISAETIKIFMHTPSEKIDLSEVTAIWYRRFIQFSNELKEKLDPKFGATAFAENKQAILALMGLLDEAFLFNHRDFNRIADNKQYELKVARQFGLNIPKTCTTGNPEVARQFVKSLPAGAITKLQIGYSQQTADGEENLYTSTVTEEMLANMDDLVYCPMMFQEKIEKKLELRTTIVGNQFFTIALDSSKLDNADSDWRRAHMDSRGKWTTYELPEEIKNKLLLYMDYFGLNYGSGDLILTPDDRYVFLEMNPGGEFGWVDFAHQGALSKAIAGILANTLPRRRHNPLFQPRTIIAPFEI